MTLADYTELYQAHLEAHRAYPEDEDIREMLEVAKRALEIAWLEVEFNRQSI